MHAIHPLEWNEILVTRLVMVELNRLGEFPHGRIRKTSIQALMHVRSETR
jgi:hypothetical protein